MKEIKNSDNENGIVLLTSRYWEGAYVLNEFIKQKVPCSSVIVQKTWWRTSNSYDYSDEYLKKLVKDNDERTYFTIEDLTKLNNIDVKLISNVNSDSFDIMLELLKPSVIAVVGSRIIKPNIINKYKDKFINYHTGILPQYRGPYSEFWALYENRPEDIGTTIHFIDEGIDTGKILAYKYTDIGKEIDPQKAHILNAKSGASLMATTINRLLAGTITPMAQDENKANYYTYPEEDQIKELEARLKIKIKLYYAD